MRDSAYPGVDAEVLLPGMPVLQRLALAYAPARAKPATLALLALDSRLAALVRGSSEPLLAQIRLAWWRDRLGGEARSEPKGEPVLAALRGSGFESRALVPLVDGWEAMTREPPLQASAFAALADGRGRAFAELAVALGCDDFTEAALRTGKAWALADIAARLSSAEERRRGRELAIAETGAVPMPRALRALTVLHGIERRRLRRGAGPGELTSGDLLAAIRLGIVGR